MALNASLGHLYHDGNINDMCIRLDAKEHLQVKERNTRESNYLGKYIRTVDRSKRVCMRLREWEQEMTRKQLDTINTKTQSLEDYLKKEGDKLRRCKETFLDTSSPVKRIRDYHSHIGGRFQLPPTTTETTENVSLWLPPKNSFTTPEDIKVQSLKRRVGIITKSLRKMYSENTKRRNEVLSQSLEEIIGTDAKKELDKAKVILKATSAADEVDAMLGRNQIALTKFKLFCHNTDPRELYSYKDDKTNENKDLISSVLVNPSEECDSDADTHMMKWTDLFPAPQVWKQKHLYAIRKAKMTSIVTLTAKYRNSMLKSQLSRQGLTKRHIIHAKND